MKRLALVLLASSALISSALAQIETAPKGPELAPIPSEFDPWAAPLLTTTSGVAEDYQPPPYTNRETKMRFFCAHSHLLYEDPIVSPGVPYSTHLHAFFGNTLAGKDSTYASLRTTGDGTCAGGAINRTAYWMPAMIHGGQNKVVLGAFEWYYQIGASNSMAPRSSSRCPTWSDGDGRPMACPMHGQRRIERGMKMIAGFSPSFNGFPVRGTPGTMTGRNFSWHCQVGNGDYIFEGRTQGNKTYLWNPDDVQSGIEDCPSTNAFIVFKLSYPVCWNGQYDGTGAANVRNYNHLSYSNGDNVDGQQYCPASHPYRQLGFNLFAFFRQGSNNEYREWYLSSDRHNGATFISGQTGHSDSFWGWDEEIKLQWENEVIGLFQDGTTGNIVGCADAPSPPTQCALEHGRTTNNGGIGPVAALGGIFKTLRFQGLSAPVDPSRLVDIPAFQPTTGSSRMK